MRYLPSFVIALALCSPVHAQNARDKDRALMPALSPLMAGILGGAICDKTINRSAGVKYIQSQMDPNSKFDIEQIVFTAWYSAAQQNLQASLGALPKGKAEMKKYCASMMQAFGPSGTKIAALLSD